MQPSDFPEQFLAEVICHQLARPCEGLRFERCSTGKFNTSFFVTGMPRPLVLRIAPPDDPSQVLFYEYRMMRQEPAIHELLRAQTAIPIPAIVAIRVIHCWIGIVS